MGSELAFYRLLKALNKTAVIINEDYMPYGYDFLPQADLIRKFKRNMKNVKFDVFVALDCSDLKRTGEVYTLNREQKTILNIDHHISNVFFGQINWVNPNACSCAQMIYELYKKMRIPIDRETALLLYVGIATDTGYFRYSNTKRKTHKIVSDLLRHDLNIPQVYKNLNENIPYEDMKLLCDILPMMRRSLNGKIVWYQIKKRVFKGKKKLSFDLTEHILSFARSIKDVEVVVLFKENFKTKNEVRVNFRSQGKIDVNSIAGSFGGGGHKTASGCTIKGKIDDVRRKVLREVTRAFRKI